MAGNSVYALYALWVAWHEAVVAARSPAAGGWMPSTIPKQFSISLDGRSYRGTYSLKDDMVTVRHTAPDGVIRKMSRPIEGLKAIAVARTILRELA